MARVAINGFGRIGRCFFRAARGRREFEIVALNDLASLENLVYLLKYDTVYGRAPFSVAAQNGALIVDGAPISFTQEKELAKLSWREHAVEVVVESTGAYTDPAKARGHIEAGAKHVVISAPAKGAGAETILIGANEEKFGTSDISSNASCTTAAASPLIGILDEAIGIERAILNTTHAYTASQLIVDGPSKKEWKDGRAAAQNLIPTSTGSAIAVTLAYPSLSGKFDGIAVRVPIATGSLVDVTFVSKRRTSVEEVNAALKTAAASDRWRKVFAVTEDPIVSSDVIGEPYGAIADLEMTRVVDGSLVKVLAWYDNEMGYAHTLVEHVAAVAKHL